MAVSILLGVSMSIQADEKAQMTPQQEKATAAIREYFRRVTHRIASNALAGVNSLQDWERVRPQLREEIRDMLGLSPLPERTDLHATITGTTKHEDVVVERLHFQSMPGLYVTGNFYRPKEVASRLPTVLYLCGHAQTKVDDVAYGAKVSYQHHPTWFARNGYCCLIIDTLQLGEIEGLHHGTNREGMWWWVARGYTPAGVEAWNCVRALDYLETRPEVDMKRIGVTGRSGGGAYTWWLAAIDDRPACLIPVAGITDLENHVVDDCIEGHCDCMYMVNTYQWDFAMVAALAAPRPLLLSNSDKDSIFPLDGVVRTHRHVRRIYELYGATDKLGLLITEGPHRDTQDLQVPAFRWMNRWLKNDNVPIDAKADKLFKPKDLKVFTDLPADQRNTSIHEIFVPPADVPPLPSERTDWDARRETLFSALKKRVFAGWPKDAVSTNASTIAEKEAEGIRLRVMEYTTEENLRLPLYVMWGSRHKMPSLLVLTVLQDEDWKDWIATFAPAFADILSLGDDVKTLSEVEGVKPNHERFDGERRLMDRNDWAFAVIAPRGFGPNQWNPESRKVTHFQRRFVLLGTTADSGRVWDVRQALRALRTQPELRSAKVWVQGKGRAAGIALYAGLFEPEVARFDLHGLPSSHRDGPYFLNILRVTDMPQAIALAFPRTVILYDTDECAWNWPQSVARLYDPHEPPLQFRNNP